MQKPLFGAQGKGLRLIASLADLASPEEVNGVYYLQEFVPPAQRAPSGLAALRLRRPRHCLHDQTWVELDHQYQAGRARQGRDREPGARRSCGACRFLRRRRLCRGRHHPGARRRLPRARGELDARLERVAAREPPRASPIIWSTPSSTRRSTPKRAARAKRALDQAAQSPRRSPEAFHDACLAELEALKPGNVHRFGEGHRMSVADFEASADAAAAAHRAARACRGHAHQACRRGDEARRRAEHQSRHHPACAPACRRGARSNEAAICKAGLARVPARAQRR